MEPWGIQRGAFLEPAGLRFEVYEYTPGHWAGRHAHENAFFDLVLSGAQEGRWAGEEVRRVPGTLAVLPPGEPHAMDSVSPTRAFQVVVEPSWSGFAEGTRLAGHCAHFEPGPMAWGFTRLWAEFRRPDDLTPLVLESRLAELVAEHTSVPAARDEAPRWLSRAHDYVRAHARQGFTVAEVAAEAAVAPAHLMRTYARRYGRTLGDDARRHRVVHACRLLASPAPSLGEVALETGFGDQSHLNRVFKRHTGLTPREYRETSLGR